MTRRQLLSAAAVTGGVGLAGIIAVPAVVHSLSPVLTAYDEPVWRPLGPVDGYPPGEVRKAVVEVSQGTRQRAIREKAVFVWHSEQEGLVVFARDCTDLGCQIELDKGNDWFFCPCHGGIFSTDGEPQAGPPNRPLFRYTNRIREGILEIDLRSLPPVT